ncbi:P-loop NTPase [Chloroflexota bacterium]
MGSEMANENKLVDLLRINAEIGWKCDFRCQDCHRFFECPLPQKIKFYQGGRIETITKNLSNVKHIIAVTSGKGGVGKSIISANLAVALAKRGYCTAIMDSDIYGPSIPSILGVDGGKLKSGTKGIVPPQGPLGVKIVSMAFLLGYDSAVTWLSDLKRSAQELFLANTDYGPLDYLIVDMPPGTGSETVNLLKYLPQITGVLIVTAPSDVTGQVVHRCISLCQQAKVPIIGLIENMSSFTCPQCGNDFMLDHSSTDMLSEETRVPLLGKIARDPLVVSAADRGLSFVLEYPDSKASKDLLGIVDKIEGVTGGKGQETEAETSERPPENQLLEIVEINAGSSCYSQSCFNCTRYFQCVLPKKYDLYNSLIFQKIKESMSGIKHKIAIMSCKGGVGKSTFAANLAVALSQQGSATTILDCDFHGPCIPRILGVEGQGLKIGRKGIVPASGYYNVGVISLAFVIQPDEAVTWFDSLKKVTVEQFLNNVDYGNLDYLIIDLPPGTGAESYSLLQNTPNLDGVIIITLPSESPQEVARRSVALCRQANVPVIGLVENMSTFLCPSCKKTSRLCGTKAAKDLARKIKVRFLGEMPFDNSITNSCDEGVPFVVKYAESAGTRSLLQILEKVRKTVEDCNIS